MFLSKKGLLIISVSGIGLLFGSTFIGQAIKKNQPLLSNKIGSITIDAPTSAEARTPKFLGLDTAFLATTLDQKDLQEYKKQIETFNINQGTIWHRKVWNLNLFQDKNLPIIVGKINNTQLFSSFYQDRGLRFLDLPIHMPDQGWRIPVELEQFKEVIKMAVNHERLCHPEF